MKKLVILLLAVCLLTGCVTVPGESTGTAAPESTGGNGVVPDNPNVKFFRKVATELHGDGWAYSVVGSGTKGETGETIRFSFSAINLRYRCHADYIIDIYTPRSEGNYLHIIYAPAYMQKGFGPYEEFLDIKQINDFLQSGKTPDALLREAPEALELQVLDEALVLRLLRRAVESDPQPEGTNMDYWRLPGWGLLAEPAYTDGYKFQVGFLNETGSVDALFIDVLYKTGEAYNEYVQLSDLVEAGTATQAQTEAFALIETLTGRITDTEYFLETGDEYKNLVIGEIDFSRLYAFLSDLHEANTEPYLIMHEILFEELVTEDQVPPERIPPEGVIPIAPWW